MARRWLLGAALAISTLSGCGVSTTQPAPTTAAPASTLAPPAASPGPAQPVTPPTWKPGDRWTYAWTSGTERGQKTVEVREIRELNGVRYYVVRNAEADHYWTLDLHWVGSVRNAKAEARMDPPEPWYRWPLEIGRQWEHRGEFAQADGKRRAVEDVFVVLGTEAIQVPAGTFQGVRITRTGRAGDTDEYWYVPEVRSYVRWIGRRFDAQGNVQEFEERLSEFRAAGTSPPSREPLRAPSGLR